MPSYFCHDCERAGALCQPERLRPIVLTWEEAMDFGWVKSIHPEDRERSVNGWRAAVESNTPYVGVNRYLHDDGTVVWVDVRTAPVCDGEKVFGYVGVVQDITERTRVSFSKHRSFLVPLGCGGAASKKRGVLCVLGGSKAF